MRRGSEDGFTMMELMIATAVLLVVLSTALWFFSRSQIVYSNERATLDMVQDLRMAFDRFTNEVRMSGSGLPPEFGVISGTPTMLVVRGDFSNITTTVMTKGSGSNIFLVGTASRFAAGQTIAIYSMQASRTLVARISSVDTASNTIIVDPTDFFPLSAGATLADMGPGSIINVIERRTYKIIEEGNDKGSLRRTVAYDTIGEAPGAVLYDEIIARNVLTPEGKLGLTFSFFGLDDIELAGGFDPSDVYKVRIDLQVRTAERDLENNEYRTLDLRSLVQVRNMYQQ